MVPDFNIPSRTVCPPFRLFDSIIAGLGQFQPTAVKAPFHTPACQRSSIPESENKYNKSPNGLPDGRRKERRGGGGERREVEVLSREGGGLLGLAGRERREANVERPSGAKPSVTVEERILSAIVVSGYEKG